MAKSWRGYRPIVVGGRRFRWKCTFSHPMEVLSVGYAERGAEWSPDVLEVRLEENPRHHLAVCWPACRGPVVKPEIVRACIEEAVRRGWLTEHAFIKLAGSDVTA